VTRKKKAQEYSAREFEAVVALLMNDESIRGDIEAITGQGLAGKTPRELFDLFRAIDEAAAVQTSVARFGQARQALRATRAAVEGVETAENVLDAARARIVELEARNDALKAQNAALNARHGATPITNVVRGEVTR
jgi:hypothetical protein